MRFAAVAAVLGAVLAGCSSSGHKGAGTVTTSTSQPSQSVATIGPGAGGPGGSGSNTSSTTGAAALGGAPQNLVATADLKASLLAAFAAAKGDPQSDFSGPDKGTTYYALVPATGEYWALAHFTPTAAAGYQVDVGMQDGGAQGVFTKAPGSSTWSVKFGGFPFPCPGGPVPDALVKLWGLSYPSGCGQG